MATGIGGNNEPGMGGELLRAAVALGWMLVAIQEARAYRRRRRAARAAAAGRRDAGNVDHAQRAPLHPVPAEGVQRGGGADDVRPGVRGAAGEDA